MADYQIKDLTTNPSPALTDVMAEDNASNVTYKSTKQKLFDLISSLAAITSATAASDTVPVNISGTTSKMTLLNVIKNMVAPSTSGNVLTSDGTNWTSSRLTNVTTVASSATPSPVGSYERNLFTVTALAEAAEFAEPSGTPVNGNMLLIRVLDNGTGRALTYNAIYRAVGVTLKITTTANKSLYFIAIYNSTATKWDVISVAELA